MASLSEAGRFLSFRYCGKVQIKQYNDCFPLLFDVLKEDKTLGFIFITKFKSSEQSQRERDTHLKRTVFSQK
jgi:hypothetical protein